MRHTPEAFTLVELLVVITIIVLLLALLTPAMEKAMELSQRAVCAANLHGTGAGLAQYGFDNRWALPEAQPSYKTQRLVDRPTGAPATVPTTGWGIYAVWIRENVAEYDGYLGHGRAAQLKYLQPKSLYCPSNTFTGLNYDEPWDGSAATAVMVGGVPVTAGAGGWPASGDPVEADYTYIWTGYHYRATLGAGADYLSPKLKRDGGHEPVLADVFSDGDGGRNVDRHHMEGYTVLRLSGAAAFTPDPDAEVKFANGGVHYSAGAAEYIVQKRVWEEFFARN